MRRIVLAGLILAGLLVPASPHPPAADEEPAPVAEFIGGDTCASCHDDVAAHLALTPHGSGAFAAKSDHGCETCHGPGSRHMENLDDVALQPRIEAWPVAVQIDLCLSCHQADQSQFHASPHAFAGLACAGCHDIHGDDAWKPASDGGPGRATSLRTVSGSSETCVGCHQDVEAEFAATERHRLQEGILECASCHDPHAPAVRIRLGGFKNDQCVSCHGDKGGPFVFEHGSQIVEGCTACHTPHGSPNRHMLKFQSVGELCYSCHNLVPGFHFGFNPTAPPRFGLDTNCTNCHSTIHGSNFDPSFLK